MSTVSHHDFPKLHNAMWPGLVGKGPDSEPTITLDTMLDLTEAANIDGASRWRAELRVTLPLLRQSIALSLILSVIGSFLAFNQFQILTQGGPGTSTTPIVLWIYQVAFEQGLIGKATAGAMLLVVVVGIISAGQFLLLRDRNLRAS